MKEIDHLKSFSIEFPPATIFIDDIEDIYKIISSVSEEVEISSDKYSFESLDELKDFKGKITQLKISGSRPSISVNIDKWVRIYASEDTVITRGLAEKVKFIIEPRIKKFNTKNKNSKLLWVIFTGSWILSFTITDFAPKQYKTVSILSLFSLGAISLFWDYYTSFIRHSTIKFSFAKNSPSFWVENKDKIIVGTITGIIGSMITLVFKKMFG